MKNKTTIVFAGEGGTRKISSGSFKKKNLPLAEGVTSGDVSADKHQAAFTLAEVLITLGIIGIIAAMTLPSLIARYQKKVWAAQLKYNVSLLSQGFHKIAGENEGLQMTSLGRSVCFTTTSGNKHCSATYNCSWFYPFQRDQAKKTWQILNVGCDTVTDVDCPRETIMKKGHYWVQHTFDSKPGNVMNTIYSG